MDGRIKCLFSISKFACSQLLGAALIDWLDVHVDFLNGIYFSFLCLTAIEYGKLIPTEFVSSFLPLLLIIYVFSSAAYLPLVIAYICFGLAISTIALGWLINLISFP
jgi:hypothetical protein